MGKLCRCQLFEFDLILLVTAALVGMAVTTIWKKLSSKPELNKNKRLLMIHFAVLITFVAGFFIVIIILFMCLSEHHSVGDLWYILTTIVGVDNFVN